MCSIRLQIKHNFSIQRLINMNPMFPPLWFFFITHTHTHTHTHTQKHNTEITLYNTI